MIVMLMRHAEAEWGEQMDPTRHLTDTGKKQAKMMGKWLARQADAPTLILQSNFHRSQATAKRMAKKLDALIITTGRLDPEVSPEQACGKSRSSRSRTKQPPCSQSRTDRLSSDSSRC